MQLDVNTAAQVAAVAVAVFSGYAPASAQQAVRAGGSAVQGAVVSVDFAQSRGKLLRTERLNTWDNGDPEPQLRKNDIAFLVDQGLRSEIVRVGIKVDTHMCDLEAQACDFTAVNWLFDVSKLTEALVVHLTPEGLFKADREPADLVPLLTLAIRELKEQIPNIAYIEAFNEPDWVHYVQQVRRGQKPDVLPEQLYSWYVPFYEAVNTINAELHPNDRLRVGGPTLMSFDHKGWVPAFLDGFAADSNPGKRLDFISWHGYGYFDEAKGYRTHVFFKDDPSMVATQRARLDAMLKERNLGTHMPALVTETGIYPGPAFDEPDPSRNDWLRQAPGLASLHYWWLEQPNIYPFHWTVRHAGEGRKDQLVTLRGENQTSPVRTFTPYGNLLLMQSKLRDERVVAKSNALNAGKGVYAIATKDDAGTSVMIWNYQGSAATPYRVTLDMAGLPANARGSKATQTQYRIDQSTSNYWTDPTRANLQQVGRSTVTLSAGHRLTIDLPPNSLHLVTLDYEAGATD
jgi:hypothetical protein